MGCPSKQRCDPVTAPLPHLSRPDTQAGPQPDTWAAAILARQRAAFLRDGPPSLAERRADLKNLRAALIAARPRIEAAITADFSHRSRHETAMAEILPVVQGIDYLHARLPRFMAPRRRHVAPTFRLGHARVEYQPLGVIGIVAPWNYPVALALMPLATAIAAGNRAMIKPSEITPRTSELIAGLLAGLFAPEQVAVTLGDATVGAGFTALPFDHLVFTGSTRVGHAVMRAASENLVPLTLELGGKSPVIIAPGHADARSAAGIAFGKLTNAGQTCIAPDYVLLHAADRDAFVTAYDRAVAELYPLGPSGDDYSAIVNGTHFDRLSRLASDAADKGARVMVMGRAAGTASDLSPGRAQTIPPMLVLDPTDDMALMQQEIFGPILPVLTYRDMDQAIAQVNARPRPLALYYFGPDDADRRKVLARTTSGNVGINNTLMHYAQDDLPFGGVGPSGMGAYHGIEGFRALSHAKGIYVQGRWNAARLMRAPFGRLADRLLALLLR